MPEPETAQDFQGQLLAAALAYANAGYAVFPVHGPAKIDACSCYKGRSCDNIGKHPIAELVPHGLLGATTDELTIRRWWKHSPRANIGLPVPSGKAVLDIDGPEGLEALADAGWHIPETARAATRRGWHYWFTTTTDIRPGSDFMTHVDMRGPGGYVIAPPSMHAKGSLYEWEAFLLETPLAPAPDWLYELASRPSRAHAEAIETARVDMASILSGVNEGRRDRELFRAASSMRHSNVPYDLALAVILKAAADCTPPFPEQSAKEKVDSAYGRYQPSIQLDSGDGEITLLARDAVKVLLNSPKGPVEFHFRDMEKIGPTLDCELRVASLQPGTSNDTYEQKINLLSQSARESARREMVHILDIEAKTLTLLFNRAITEAKRQFLSQPRAVRVSDIPAPDRIEYAVDQFLLDSDRTNILFGPGGSLKTYVMYSIMLSMAAGHDWLGRKVQRRNILLIDYETGQKMAGYRLQCLARGIGLEDALDNIHWWDPDGIPLFEITDPLKRDIERLNIGYLGIDHVALACGTEPERAESALRYSRALSRLKTPSMSLAHVTGNVADNPELASRPFGSIMWSNIAALTWFIQKEDQNEGSNFATVGMFQRKWNDTGRLRDFSVSFEFQLEDGLITLDQSDMRESVALRATQGQKFMVFDALVQPATIEQLKDATGLNVSAVRTVLNRYKGMFERVTGPAGGAGNKALWQRVETGTKTGTPLRETDVTEDGRQGPEGPTPETGTKTGTKPAQPEVVTVFDGIEDLPF